MAEKTEKGREFLAGMRAGIPIVLGYIPVAVAYAVMARQAGFTAAETAAMSVAVYAGASQMMATEMYAQGAGISVIILAALIMNLRHVVMSTCVVSRLQKTRPAMRLLLAFGVTDETFALFTAGAAGDGSAYYFWGLITAAYASWIAGSALGAVVSGALPALLSASLGIALYALFIGLLVPNLRGNGRLGLLVAVTAAVSAVLSRFLPSGWSMIVSTLVCAAGGALVADKTAKEGKADE